MDFAIDNDKIVDSSEMFRDLGFQISGFHNFRLGPTMSCIGNAQTVLMYSIIFSRHGDVALSIVKSLLK